MASKAKDTESMDMSGQLGGLSELAVSALRSYFEQEDPSKAARDKARIANSVINTAVSIKRATWNQQRHETNIAKTLADGDLDVFQGFVTRSMGFPAIRKAALPEG